MPEAQPTSNTRQIAPALKVGDPARPLGDKVRFPHAKPTLVVFLRQLGDPFAEKTFRILTNISAHHPEIRCVAVTQSDQAASDEWAVSVGGEWETIVVPDPERRLYADWGLGESSTWYNLNPLALWSTYKLGTEEGFWGDSPQYGGSKWQIGGAFALDRAGIVVWSKPAASSDEVPDFRAALRALGISQPKEQALQAKRKPREPPIFVRPYK